MHGIDCYCYDCVFSTNQLQIAVIMYCMASDRCLWGFGVTHTLEGHTWSHGGSWRLSGWLMVAEWWVFGVTVTHTLDALARRSEGAYGG